MRNFADIMKEEREKLSLSQTELGKELLCSRYRIADLERGKITPTIEDINLLCGLYGVSADYLLGRSEIRTPDISTRQICENTGLTEAALEGLRKQLTFTFDEASDPSITVRNALISSGALTDICNALAAKESSVSAFRNEYGGKDPTEAEDAYCKAFENMCAEMERAEYGAVKRFILFVDQYSKARLDISEYENKFERVNGIPGQAQEGSGKNG